MHASATQTPEEAHSHLLATSSFAEVAAAYYSTHWPRGVIQKLLTVNKTSFKQTELSFVWDSREAGRLVSRWQSFESAHTLGDYISRMCVRNRPPRQVDVGAAYTGDMKVASQRKPAAALFTLDFDFTDWELFPLYYSTTAGVSSPHPGCSSVTAATDTLWPVVRCWMQIAEFCLKKALSSRIKLCWVYSGRRGVHCVVSDPRLCVDRPKTGPNTADVRSAIVSSLFPQSSQMVQMPRGASISFDKQLVAAQQCFETFLLKPVAEGGMNLLCCSESRRVVLGFLTVGKLTKSFQDAVTLEWSKLLKGRKQSQTGTMFWNALKSEVGRKCGRNALMRNNILERVMLRTVWPRVDANVSKIGHLAKLMFTIHPATGRIAMPIDRDTFHPTDHAVTVWNISSPHGQQMLSCGCELTARLFGRVSGSSKIPNLLQQKQYGPYEAKTVWPEPEPTPESNPHSDRAARQATETASELIRRHRTHVPEIGTDVSSSTYKLHVGCSLRMYNDAATTSTAVGSKRMRACSGGFLPAPVQVQDKTLGTSEWEFVGVAKQKLVDVKLKKITGKSSEYMRRVKLRMGY